MMLRIQTKITFTFLLLTLLAVVAFAFFASFATEQYLTQEKTIELARRIDVLAPLLSPEVSDSAAGALHRHVHRLAVAMNLRVTLIDSAGVVLVDSDVPVEKLPSMENHAARPEVRQALMEEFGSAERHSTTVDQDYLYVAKVKGVQQGADALQNVKVIRLSAHLGDIQRMARDERNNLLLAGGLAVLLIGGVSMFVSRRISQPMTSIAEAVERIRRGDLDTRIEVQGDDEVGRVAQAVNELVDNLKTDILQLKKLERVRSEFLGNVSHELRTPIFSLQGFLETLIEGAVDDPTVNRDFLTKAYHHSQRLNTLLGELITISQIESGEMKMSFRYFTLFDFLNEVVEEFRPTAENYRVQVRLEEALSRDVQVLGDKERLRVVFENLFENAIKYNKPNGEVTVSYEPNGDHVTIRVSDTGVGIAKEHLPRIFERFYRVDTNRSREVGGTGLGLAIVKHIVEAHGSTVEVISERGRGSMFSFSLKT